MNNNTTVPKKETLNWNNETPTEVFFREILLSFSEESIKTAITAASDLKARNVKELTFFQLKELEANFGIPVGRRILEVLQPNKILGTPKKRAFADANVGTAEAKDAAKNRVGY